MKKHCFACIFLACASTFFCTSTFAADSTKILIQKRFKKHLGADIKLSNITKTSYGQLYEVQIGTDLFYTDKNANYLFMGSVLDLETKQNLTEEKQNQISKISFATLPKELAIKIVKGNGKREMAVFSDPNCHHCKQLEHNLRRINNVTIYLYPLSILSERSEKLSRNIWCSPNPGRTWTQWMNQDFVPPSVPDSCTFPHQQIVDLAEKLNISGTPTVFFSDGTRVPGVIEANNIDLKLQSLE